MKICSVEGCDRVSRSRGLCSKHYRRLWRHGDPGIVLPTGLRNRPKRICSVDGCDRLHEAYGYCKVHYRHFKMYGDPLIYGNKNTGECEINGCGKKQSKRHMCVQHYNEKRSLEIKSNGPCSVGSCQREVTYPKYQLCRLHYARFMRHGDPEMGRRYKIADLRDRFMSYVQKMDEESCWPWQGQVMYMGYGMFSIKGHQVKAHKFMYNLMIGEVPKGLVIDHTCHNKDPDCLGGYECLHRRCVNPNHFEAVTRGENSKRGKGRTLVAWRNNTCVAGHDFTEENTYLYTYKGQQRRYCKRCAREYREKRKTLKAGGIL